MQEWVRAVNEIQPEDGPYEKQQGYRADAVGDNAGDGDGGGHAQQPSPSPKKPDTKKAEPQAEITSAQTGEDGRGYTITSSVEFGYRGVRVDGDVNKYQSDLNYKAGPRLFDASFLMQAKDGKGEVFDSLLITSTGWGADPYGNLRISVEKPEWYKFDGTYRRAKFYRFLNTIANPNWLFSPAQFAVPPNPATGLHGFNTKTEMGDFDLTILPKNRTIRFNVGIRLRGSAVRLTRTITFPVTSSGCSRS